MGSGLTADLEVLVTDVGVDAALVELGGERVLMLRPGMSFGAAVEAVVGACPGMGGDDAAAIVRKALPDAVNLDELIGFRAAQCACAPTPESSESRGASVVRRLRARGGRQAVGTLSLAVLLCGAFAAGRGAYDDNVNADLAALQARVADNTAARAAQTRGPSAAQVEATQLAVERVLERGVREPDLARGVRTRESKVSALMPAHLTKAERDLILTQVLDQVPASMVTEEDLRDVVAALLESLTTPPPSSRRQQAPSESTVLIHSPSLSPSPTKPEPEKDEPAKEDAARSETVLVKETTIKQPSAATTVTPEVTQVAPEPVVTTMVDPTPMVDPEPVVNTVEEVAPVEEEVEQAAEVVSEVDTEAIAEMVADAVLEVVAEQE